MLHTQDGESCQEPIYIKVFGLNVNIASMFEILLIVGSEARPCFEGCSASKEFEFGRHAG